MTETLSLERFSVSRRTLAFHLPEALSSSSSSSGFLGSLEGKTEIFPDHGAPKLHFPFFHCVDVG